MAVEYRKAIELIDKFISFGYSLTYFDEVERSLDQCTTFPYKDFTTIIEEMADYKYPPFRQILNPIAIRYMQIKCLYNPDDWNLFITGIDKCQADNYGLSEIKTKLPRIANELAKLVGIDFDTYDLYSPINGYINCIVPLNLAKKYTFAMKTCDCKVIYDKGMIVKVESSKHKTLQIIDYNPRLSSYFHVSQCFSCDAKYYQRLNHFASTVTSKQTNTIPFLNAQKIIPSNNIQKCIISIVNSYMQLLGMSEADITYILPDHGLSEVYDTDWKKRLTYLLLE